MPDHNAWPEFTVPWDDNLPGPADMSFLLDKPAGAKGFIQIVDGRLAAGDGVRWLITNTPMVDAPDHSAIAQLSRSRVKGMPYVASEINEPFPNDYAAEYIPIMASYGLLQDWDGLFFFCYGGGTEEQWKDSSMRSYFSMANTSFALK